eukprot:gene10441-14024_t
MTEKSTDSSNLDELNINAESVGRGSHPKMTNEYDDIETSSLTSWLVKIEKSIAKSRKIRGGNYVQIASVDSNGMPHCRTVVFRGMVTLSDFVNNQKDGGDRNNNRKDKDNDNESGKNSNDLIGMKMITDLRSDKVTDFINNPNCEMVWWFSQSSEQYRINGKILLVGEDMNNSKELLSLRKQQWGNLSDSAREQFYWYNPGVSYSGIPVVPSGGRDIENENNVLPPPANFLLMILLPKQIKYLNLKNNYAQFDHFNEIKKEWESIRVNP